MIRYIRPALAAGVAVCALSLAACAASSGPVSVLEALGENYAYCQRTVTYTAAVGPLNPASGGNITGTVNCPAREEKPPAAPSQASPPTVATPAPES